MNLPNKLTVLRVVMVPFFVFFMLTDVGGAANKWIALVLFCVASFTDFLDGQIARKNNLVTNFGKFMDPLADKLLVCSAMICLIEMGKLSAVHYQRFPAGGFRQRHRDRGQLLGEIQDRVPDGDDDCIDFGFWRRVRLGGKYFNLGVARADHYFAGGLCHEKQAGADPGRHVR